MSREEIEGRLRSLADSLKTHVLHFAIRSRYGRDNPQDKFRDDLTALLAENERLREAAAPFAKFGETLSQMGGNTPKSGPWHTVVSREGEAAIEVEDFNRIRAALKDPDQ